MAQRPPSLSGATAGAAATPFPIVGVPSARALSRWLGRYAEELWIGVILLVAALAHGVNMYRFPYYENDEGTYMSQAWAVLTQGSLAPYTYWYDHAPMGWLQLAAWVRLTGGFYTFGSAIDTGRVFMLILQVASTLLMYRIARSVSSSKLVATLAALTFALSAFGIYFHRRVLLDNIATFWLLLSMLLLVSGRLTLTRVWASALAMGLSVLSKEVSLFVVPALTYLVYVRSHRSQRWFAVIGWLGIVGSLVSTYPLMATLKSELLPSGAPVGNPAEHVSLADSLRFQAARGKDAGLFSTDSRIWQVGRAWIRQEPFLVPIGTLAALFAAIFGGKHPFLRATSIATLFLWAFLVRGGEVLEFYLLPLLPLLSLNTAIVIGLAVRRLRAILERRAQPPGWANAVSSTLAVAFCASFTLAGYVGQVPNPDARDCSKRANCWVQDLGYERNPLILWQSPQVESQKAAMNWLTSNVWQDSALVIDNFMWTDLHEVPFPRAHYYYKVDLDPAIRSKVFHDDWRTVDYLAATDQMLQNAAFSGLELVSEALKNSTSVYRFNADIWPVEVWRVNKVHSVPAAANPLLTRSWVTYRERFIQDGRVVDPRLGNLTTSEGQSYALLRAVYVDDKQTFGQAWQWTKEHLQVRGDGLFAWRWGARPDGVQAVLDDEAAPDADEDIALALLFAAQRWNAPEYRQEAKTILNGIWEQETAMVAGHRMLVAGPWARGDSSGGFDQPVVNPSYLAPYAYRIFATVDQEHAWLDLVAATYDVLAWVRASPDHGGAAGVVPDWLILDSETGEFLPTTPLGANADLFSYDASRLPWRLALDWLWFRDNRAKEALEGISLPRRELARGAALYTAYHLDGTPAVNYEALSMYASTLASLLIGGEPAIAHKVYAERILHNYVNNEVNGRDSGFWSAPDDYHGENWAWFAAALMDGGLGNLYAGETTIHWDGILP